MKQSHSRVKIQTLAVLTPSVYSVLRVTLLPNARDNDLSQLMNGYLTPLSAWMYPKYYSNVTLESQKTNQKQTLQKLNTTQKKQTTQNTAKQN